MVRIDGDGFRKGIILNIPTLFLITFYKLNPLLKFYIIDICYLKKFCDMVYQKVKTP